LEPSAEKTKGARGVGIFDETKGVPTGGQDETFRQNEKGTRAVNSIPVSLPTISALP
jgi:hypothetical protein